MGLIQQGARRRHLWICEHRIPARFLALEPASHTLAIGGPSRMSDMVRNVPQPLAKCKHAPALALARPVPQGVKLGASRLTNRRRDGREFAGELDERMAEAGAQARSWKERPHALGRASEAIGENPFDPGR
jgi:hypothetical protein